METLHKSVLEQFRLDAPAVSCERYGCGHINETYLVVTQSGRRYILQKISNRAFPDVAGLQENIAAVTAHLRAQTDDPYGALNLIYTKAGESWHHQGENSDWRVYDFVENSICLQAPESPEDFYQSAIAFGTFQQQLSTFPAQTLHETIQNFHNTPDRYRLFRQAVEEDVMGRAAQVQPEIAFALSHEEIGGELTRMLREGALPLRVTHNDTKLNNVLLDHTTGKAMCVVDLDTVMPGLCAYDFGDAIRFGANTAAEDEVELDRVHFSLPMFRAYCEGYLEKTGGLLTEAEVRSLPLGAWMMTYEVGIRFLTDYLDGDCYFHTDYPEHNLVRARNQFALLKDMERQEQAMQAVVDDCLKGQSRKKEEQQ